MKSLVIDRGELLTGKAISYVGTSSLRDPQSGLMCCVGCYGNACGVDRGYLNDRAIFDSFPAAKHFMTGDPNWLFQKLDPSDRPRNFSEDKWKSLTDVQDLLTATNDDQKLHPIRREARIKKLFKKYGGIDVTFTGSYRTGVTKARRAHAS